MDTGDILPAMNKHAYRYRNKNLRQLVRYITYLSTQERSFVRKRIISSATKRNAELGMHSKSLYWYLNDSLF